MMSCMTGKAAEAGPSCESSCLPVREGSSHHHHQLRNCHYHHHRHPSTSQHLGPVTLYNSCKVLEPRTTAMWPSEAPCCWQKPCFRVGCSTTGCRLPTTATATVSSAFHKTFHPTHPSNMSFHIQKLPGKKAKALLLFGCSTLDCWLPTTDTATVSSTFHPTHPICIFIFFHIIVKKYFRIQYVVISK